MKIPRKIINMLSTVKNKLFYNKIAARVLIKPILIFHTFCYKIAGRYGILLNNGVHPKHGIIKYKEMFVDHIKSDWVILDVGSNTGLLTCALAAKANYVYGIEIIKANVDIAEKTNKKNNIEYIYGDATDYNFKMGKAINCVTLSNVLEHIEDRISFLRSIVRQINWAKNQKPCILIRVPMIDREWIVLYKKQLGLDYKLDPTHHIEYTLEELSIELLKAGIQINKTIIQYGEAFVQCSVS